MAINAELKAEILRRLYHSHPAGLGNEILDNHHGDNAVMEVLHDLQEHGLIHKGNIHVGAQGERSLVLPIKLTSAGADAAKDAE
ncbi:MULTISPECIES: hypothetical protein [Pseudomonas]|uniref:Uncharacterized protein n=1 Tax=Pseudomonas oryzihabitans TaxID=47885 RepID=A0A2Z5A688_9PSED|nr:MULTISPECIES: hypothetical protein [Pseudomonas]AXA66265.1 hypothetical protein CE139_10645 [Pseudomonas oryzihabitans]